MKRLSVFTGLLLALAASAWSQGNVSSAPDGMGAERARIDVSRQKQTAELDAESADCYSKFAVNDCQNKVEVRRRQMLADLKRQETRLNAVEHQQRSLEQLQRERNRAEERLQRERDVAADTQKKTEADRQKTLDDKVRDHRNQASPTAARNSSSKQTSVLDAPTVEKNRAAFQDKQNAQQTRRLERDQKLRDHGPGSPPLPVAP